MQISLNFNDDSNVIPEGFYVREASGNYREASEAEVLASAAETLKRTMIERQAVTDPTSMKALVELQIASYPSEVFAVAFFDSQMRLISFDKMFRGTINAASVFPRDVAARALEVNAASVAFAHNHPSGNTEPSAADQRLTDQLKKALALFDIKVVDHLIVSAGRPAFSFAEKGLI